MDIFYNLYKKRGTVYAPFLLFKLMINPMYNWMAGDWMAEVNAVPTHQPSILMG